MARRHSWQYPGQYGIQRCAHCGRYQRDLPGQCVDKAHHAPRPDLDVNLPGMTIEQKRAVERARKRIGL